MKVYKFTCIGLDSYSLNFQKFALEILDEINNDSELIENCKKCNIDFYNKIAGFNGEPEYFGYYATEELFKAPRYAYKKEINYNNTLYDVEIDYLRRTISFIEL